MENSSKPIKISKRLKIIRIILTVISACIIFVLMFNLHFSVLEKDFAKQAKRQFNEVTKLVAKEQEMILETELNRLTELTRDEFTFPSQPSKETLAYKLNNHPQNMSIVLHDGIDVKTGESCAKENFFKQSIQGLPTVTQTGILDTSSSGNIVFSVPLYNKNRVYAVLYHSLTEEEFENSFVPKFYNGEGKLYLIDLNQNQFETNLYNDGIIEVKISPNETVSTVKKAFVTSSSGTEILIGKNKQKYVLGYMPLYDNRLYAVTVADYDNVGMAESGIKKNILFFFNMVLLGAVVFAVFILLNHSISKEKLKKAKTELETVVSNIPGGVVRFMYDDCLTIQFLNDGVLKLTEYSEHQMGETFKNKFINLIHEDDRRSLAAAIVDQMTYNKTVEIDCRLKCNNGAYRWVLFKGKMFTSEADGDTCLCVLTDINETKLAQQRLNISVQRYGIIMEQSDSIIFEYNTATRSIFISDKWNNKFNPVDAKVDFVDYIITNQIVHENDILLFKSTFDPKESKDTTYECELRLLSSKGRYIWCKLKASCIFDEENNVFRIIGKISDIDEQKKERDSLKKKAEIDSLSGLYNKGTVQMMINSYLASSGKDGIHALMILDIDNFKAINDNLGHLIGDSVISDITAKMQNILRSSDICGRIGGDEFVVLMKNIKNEEIAVQKAQEMCAIFRHELVREDICIRVSGSIGIAFYDKNGLTYHELISKADTALYEAKKQGKDQYSIYGQFKADN